jgi:hypothetical protein
MRGDVITISYPNEYHLQALCSALHWQMRHRWLFPPVLGTLGCPWGSSVSGVCTEHQVGTCSSEAATALQLGAGYLPPSPCPSSARCHTGPVGGRCIGLGECPPQALATLCSGELS